MNFNYKFLVLITFVIAISASENQDVTREKDKIDDQTDTTNNKNPSKRGAFYQGHGLEAFGSYYGYQTPLLANRPVAFGASPGVFGASPVPFSPQPVAFGAQPHLHHYPHLHAAGIPNHYHLHAAGHTHAHGFGKPLNFGVPLAHPIASIPAVAPTQYAIRPGGAVVQSYNVNYPQAHFHHHKPAVFPTYAVAHAPALAPIAPSPTNHVHYHPFASLPAVPPVHHHVGFSVPAQVQPIATPGPVVAPVGPIQFPQHFFVNRPNPSFGFQFAALPAAPPTVIPQRPFFTPTIGAFPSGVVPIASGSGIASGQIPATVITPTAPTTLATPWRPIIINNPIPTTVATPQPAASGNHPPISLLPPYGAPEQTNSQIEDFQLSQLYQSQNHQNQREYFNQQEHETAEENYFGNQGYHY